MERLKQIIEIRKAFSEQMGKPYKKEILVFTLNIDDIVELDVCADEIDMWNRHDELPKEARQFIETAVNKGDVCGLDRFMYLMNTAESVSEEFYFITDKY